jgi:hypothetical protein
VRCTSYVGRREEGGVAAEGEGCGVGASCGVPGANIKKRFTVCQKRPTLCQKIPTDTPCIPYPISKRDLQFFKRDLSFVKRDLPYVKRALLTHRAYHTQTVVTANMSMGRSKVKQVDIQLPTNGSLMLLTQVVAELREIRRIEVCRGFCSQSCLL